MDTSSNDLPVVADSLQELLLTAPAIETFLQEVSMLASGLLDPVASVGITVHQGGEPLTVASSDDRAPLIDEEQYTVGQGPCLESMKTGRVVEVKDQRTDTRWGDYPARARSHGVLSSLSLPLLVDGRSLGALNLYSNERADAFGDDIREQAMVFAERASVALTLTLRYNQQANTSIQLEQALSSRTLIDQAVGILMAEQRCNAHVAFDLLRRHSQTQNRRLRDVAKDIITRVSGAPPAEPRPFEHRRPG